MGTEMRLEFQGDFLGFTYDGIHSSELGIVRTSDGSRFNENLLPTIKDNTAEVDGRDGMYFFNSKFSSLTFPQISFAFDSLTDYGIKRLKRLMAQKEPKELIFDENPYKVYMVKPTGTSQLKYVAFDENFGEAQRIYKGEGTLNFIAYFPYARSKFKALNQYTSETVPSWKNENSNIEYWKAASGMLETLDDYDGGGVSINVYNPGDIETPFKLYFDFIVEDESNGVLDTTTIKLDGIEKIKIKKIIKKKGDDIGICLDSSNNLILGYITNNGKRVFSGNLYNEYISKGDFFNIPINTTTNTGKQTGSIISLEGAKASLIEYDYLYY